MDTFCGAGQKLCYQNVKAIDSPHQGGYSAKLMRRVISSQVCLALLIAFLFAPYVHLHEAVKHSHDARGLHDHSPVVHTHPVISTHSTHHHNGDGIGILAEKIETAHEAASLTTFSFTQKAPTALSFALVQYNLLLPAPEQSSFVLGLLENRMHDPPLLSRSASRAPPA